MKDFCSGRDIDVQSLLDMLHAAEKAEQITMMTWANECKTAGCLVGTFCMTYPQDKLRLQSRDTNTINSKHYPVIRKSFLADSIFSCDRAISIRFNISQRESEFLFTSHLTTNYCSNSNRFTSKMATKLTGKQAIQRLRKFLYYKMHKSELLEDYDAARRMSDTNIVPTAKLAAII